MKTQNTVSLSYSIAICDDELLTCSELENFILTYCEKTAYSVCIDIFYSGYYLCEHLSKRTEYDIIFLDINMKNKNGIETGDYIRTTLNDSHTLITYMSYDKSFVFDLFKLDTFDFLVKPLSYKSVSDLLTRAFTKLNTLHQFFSYFVSKSLFRIRIPEIIYFQSDLRKIRLISTSLEREFYGQLDDIAMQLPQNQFIRVHKSYLINLDHIKNYTYEYIRLDTDMRINISKPYRKTVREHLLELGNKL